MDVSECLLASIELGINSVSWAMVKNELSADREYKEIAEWISGGCTGPPEVVPDHIRLYWRVSDKLRLVDMFAGRPDGCPNQAAGKGPGDAALGSPGGAKYGVES